MAEDIVLSFEGIVRHFELDGPEKARIQARLAGKHVGRVGHRFKLYRLSDAQAAILAEAEAGERREAAERRRAEQVVPTRPCAVCGQPIPASWILDRCHECMQEAA